MSLKAHGTPFVAITETFRRHRRARISWQPTKLVPLLTVLSLLKDINSNSVTGIASRILVKISTVYALSFRQSHGLVHASFIRWSCLWSNRPIDSTSSISSLICSINVMIILTETHFKLPLRAACLHHLSDLDRTFRLQIKLLSWCVDSSELTYRLLFVHPSWFVSRPSTQMRQSFINHSLLHFHGQFGRIYHMLFYDWLIGLV